MVWLPNRERVLLYGGVDADENVLSDTWEYDCRARSWTRRRPAHVPEQRFDTPLAFDEGLQRAVVSAGASAGALRGHTFMWDGTDWTELLATMGSGGWAGHTLSYDSVRGELLTLAGGAEDFRTLETMRPERRRPAFLFKAELGSAPLDWDDLAGLRVRVHAGGTSWDGEDRVEGATLSVWRTSGEGAAPGEWLDVAANAAPAEGRAPPGALITWEPAPDAVADVLSGVLQRVALRVTPLAGSKVGVSHADARVSLDHVEVRVSYGGD